MNKAYLNSPFYILLFGIMILSSCFTKETSRVKIGEIGEIGEIGRTIKTDLEYVNHAIKCAFKDKNGVLWFGSNYGVYSYSGNSFTYYSELGGLCNNRVSTIMEDNEGNLWFGTDGGICKFNPSLIDTGEESFTHTALPWIDTSSIWLDKVYPVVNPNEVRCMLQDKNGIFWIGTNGGGAYSWDGKTFTSYLANEGRKQIDSLHHNVMSSVLEDRAGNIWFTSMTHGGVSRYSPSQNTKGNVHFTHYKTEEGMSDDMVTSSFEDRSGNIWFGSLGNRSGTLDRYNGKTFTSFNEKDGLCNTNVWCMFEDKEGTLWLGSNRGNVCTYDGNTFTEFKTKEGQTLSKINLIIEGTEDHLWFGSVEGNLWRYDSQKLIDFAKLD